MPLVRISSKPASTVASPLPDVASMIHVIDSSELSKTARRFSRSTGIPIRGSTRSQKYRKEMIIGDCPKGQNYYVCQSTGFRGCCSQNACDPKVTCPEGGQSEPGSSSGASSSASTEGSNEQSGTVSPTNDSSSETSSAIAQSTSERPMTAASDSPTTEGSTKSETRPVKFIVTSASGAPSNIPANGTAIRATEDVALAPSCPRGNGTTYVDNNNIAYVVRCNNDNSAPSYNSVQVSIGGYGQCFSSCSDSSDCAGFTYVGLDDGVCYLKATMPKDTYVAKGGSNYISTAKIDPSASAPRPTPTSGPTSSMQPNKGAIAGGVVGGIAIIGLVLFLIAFIVKRRKKEIENKRATLTHIFGGAVEPGRNNDDTHTLPLHNRNGSTSHDVFAPYGGYSRGITGSVAKDYAPQPKTTSPGGDGGYSRDPIPPYPTSSPPFQPDSFDTKHPSTPLQYLPATTYQPTQHHTLSPPASDPVPLLDSTPIAPRSTSRSPRFREHISELEDTSSPPPRTKRWGSVLYAENPPAPPAENPDEMLEEARRRQQRLRFMALEAQRGGAGNAGGNEAVGGEKAPPGVRRAGSGSGKEGEVSPDLSGSPLDRSFMVSPMGSLGKARGS
ncbi:hypothetical protein WHR41_07733 [Cladosporium halotolerans]|uniref:Apple domain-containing protein n=1 Tax=Cladosporium halotolerans TaxID=1052096 RepID=A0AB34KJZ1_9PEZI